MSDNLKPEQRSYAMSRIRSSNTNPERTVRSIIHRLGYRYRLHCRDLPGKPDIVLVSRRKIVFVHGCFWHRHSCRRGSLNPKSNRHYWENKLIGNVTRDRIQHTALEEAGWSVLTVWECQCKEPKQLITTLSAFLAS
jgi:DNA mismatch endonuclease, patch repair protein